MMSYCPFVLNLLCMAKYHSWILHYNYNHQSCAKLVRIYLFNYFCFNLSVFFEVNVSPRDVSYKLVLFCEVYVVFHVLCCLSWTNVKKCI